jgi:flagellar biosynthetic protein FlhB
MVAAACVGLTTNVLQVGMKIATKSITPDFTRIDPMKGLMRMFSKQSGMELLKSIAKVSLVGYVVYVFMKGEYSSMPRMAGLSPVAIGGAIGGLCWRLMMKACTIMFIIAVVDYVYQKMHFEGTLKMTKQEVKEEYKRSEGDPQIKAKIRQRQREMSKNRMMADVPKADVVIANPTHIAIAIKYDSDSMGAPIVIAKGQRLMAEKIKSIAAANGIPIVENKPVARLLYKVVEVGQSIPEELYSAVAEILSFVYRMSRNAGRNYNKAGS